MRLTRSRSRSQTRPNLTQPDASTSATLASDRKRRPTDAYHNNGYTAEEEDQASKFLKIDEEDDTQHSDDVRMQPVGTELNEAGSKKRSRSRSSTKPVNSKKQKEQQSSQQPPAVQSTVTVTAPQPSPSLSSATASSQPRASTASRPSLQPPSKNSSSSSGSSATQRSRSHSNARPAAASAYIAPELLSGGGTSVSIVSSLSSTASLQPPVTAATKRRPSVPNLPSQSRTASSASSASTAATDDPQAIEFRLELTLERLSQLRRQLDGVEGTAQLLDLLEQVEAVAYRPDQSRASSVSQLSAVHNQLLYAMRQLAEQTAGTASAESISAARLLKDRIVPRSVASIVSSRSLLQQSLPSLITTNLPLSHKLLLINPEAVHQQDADGSTALHYAVLAKDLPLVAYLCQYGASPATTNNSRSSPLSLARLNSLDTSTMIRQPAARCTRAEAGGLTSLRQEFFTCYTCDLTGERGCCDVCSVRCHSGHVLQPVAAADNMCNEGFCDCPDVGACQASNSPTPATEHQQAMSGLDAAAVVLSSEQDSFFSTVNSSVSANNARSMLRMMEDAVVATADLMGAASGDEEESESDTAVEDDERITWSDVWQASALTAVLTLSFYAIFGGAPDLVNSGTAAVHWLQQKWQVLAASITATASTTTKH